MPVSPVIEVWIQKALRQSGRLTTDQSLTLDQLPGNPERKDHVTLQRCIARTEGKAVALVTTGSNLDNLRQRSELFARSYPELACPIFATANVDGTEVFLAEYFPGLSAEEALTEPSIGERGVLTALDALEKRFEKALRPSTQEAARAELQALFSRVQAIEYWTAADRGFLTGVVFPFAEQILVHPKPEKRVTNGDLTLQNLLLDATGAIKLIDYEQAAETHFHFEDWLRITYWKAPATVRDFAQKQIPNFTAARLYFLFKQIVFETSVIKSEKAQVDVAHWASELGSLVVQNLPKLQASLLWPNLQTAPQPASQNIAAITQAKTLDLFHYARHMANHVGRCETKIQQMQQSFSWRSTAWLRALRRTLLDSRQRPARPVPAPVFPFAIEDFTQSRAARLHYQLDTAEDEIVIGSNVCLEGWVFSPEPAKLTQVRARVGSRIYPGEYGLERPEINEKFLPQAYSRFRIEMRIEENDTRVDIEAMAQDGEWLLFFSKSLQGNSASAWASSADAIRSRYAHWVRLYDSPSENDLATLADKAQKLPLQPLISLIMPVYNPPERWLNRAIESVLQQVYPNWELCIADDASTKPHVRSILERHAKADRRIKIVYRSVNGHISLASNSALEMATGEFVACVDHDDELSPHALYFCAEMLSRHRDAEVVYSDEDKITEQGERFDPYFKPDWNPDLLRGQNYISHLTVYRTTTVRSVGAFRPGYEGSQDWDLALRVTEGTNAHQIHHIPRILYHWRAIEGSTAATLKSKAYVTEAARKTLAEHALRLGRPISLELVKGNHWRTRYPLPEPRPLVSLVIPTRNRPELLIPCIESILEKTRYSNFEIVIADNDSNDPALLAFYERMKTKGLVRVVPCPGPFNFSAINNRAVLEARGELIGLLNNDLEVITPDWLDEMVWHALRQEIGVVGAKLYYPDLRVQHAGVITGLGGVAGHAFKHFPKNDPGTPQFRPHVVHNVTALTAACIVLRKSVFAEVGGFDEENLKIAFNDVDFCLRVQARGYRNLFTPFAEFIHHESASRGAEDSPEKMARFQSEIDYMKQRWGQQLLNDPAYNPNLTLDREDFSYAFPPRISD